MSPHVEAGQWPLLLAEPAAEPERLAAEAHARKCLECARALEEGTRLLRALDSLPVPAPPTPAVLARAAAPVLAQLGSVAPGARRRSTASQMVARVSSASGLAWELVSTAAAAGLLLVTAQQRADSNEELRWALGAVLLALALSTPGLVRRLGWPGLLLAGLGAPLALLQANGSDLAGGAGGWSCAGSVLLAAALPLAALALSSARRSQPRLGSLAAAGAAATGALAGQAALAVTCPSTALGHVLVYHLGTVLLAATLGAAAPGLVRVAVRAR